MLEENQPFQAPPDWARQLQHAVNTVVEQQKALMLLIRGNAMNPDDKGLLGAVAQLKVENKELRLENIRIEKALSERMSSIEKERDKFVAYLGGAMAVGGMVVTIIFTCLKYIFPAKS